MHVASHHIRHRPFPSASTGFLYQFPAQQAEGSEVHVEVEEVQKEVEEEMQQDITVVLCKGRADAGIRGGAGRHRDTGTLVCEYF